MRRWICRSHCASCSEADALVRGNLTQRVVMARKLLVHHKLHTLCSRQGCVSRPWLKLWSNRKQVDILMAAYKICSPLPKRDKAGASVNVGTHYHSLFFFPHVASGRSFVPASDRSKPGAAHRGMSLLCISRQHSAEMASRLLSLPPEILLNIHRQIGTDHPAGWQTLTNLRWTNKYLSMFASQVVLHTFPFWYSLQSLERLDSIAKRTDVYVVDQDREGEGLF